jgi:hypothetical protein
VIDAAGTIYVIGGYDGTYYKDVWASTDGGVHRTRRGGWSKGYQGGTTRLLQEYLRVLPGHSRGTSGELQGYYGVLWVNGGTTGVLRGLEGSLGGT